MKHLKTMFVSIVVVCIVLTAIPVRAVLLSPVGPGHDIGGEQSVDLPAGGWVAGGWAGHVILRVFCEALWMQDCFTQAFESHERCRDWMDQLPTQGSDAHCWDPENGRDCCDMKLNDWMTWCEIFCQCGCWDAGRSYCTWEAFTYEMGCSGSFDEQCANY